MSFSAGSPMRLAVRALDPILDAERARGNTGRLEFGAMRDGRARWQLKHAIDGLALLAQFEFGEGISVDAEWPGGRVSFLGRQLDVLFVILGRPGDGLGSARKRAAWWAAWEAGPRERVRFENPFAELCG